MSAELKFTIVIPTRERADTLVHTLSSALALDYDNYTVLVSDNASDDSTAALVSGFNDPRIRYLNTGKRISMSHNWEFALDHVTDGWVTVLGDDDAILPDALKRVSNIVADTGVQAVRANGCGFLWPELLGSNYGILTISLKKGYRSVCSRSALKKVLAGELSYTHLPMLYNGGFVDTALIRKAKSVTGDFFLSMTPDVYSAIVFSVLTEKFIYSEEPLAINGASHHSGGTAGFEKIKRKRTYDPAEKFYAEDNIPFHQNLPPLSNGKPVRSIQAIVYEAYLQAEPLHLHKDPRNMLDKQLELILADPSQNSDEVRNWGVKFANQHDLEYRTILSRSQSVTRRLRRFTRIIKERLASLLFGFSIYGSEETPLTNVYEASLVAGSLKANNPGAYTRVVNVLSRLQRYIKLMASQIFNTRGKHA